MWRGTDVLWRGTDVLFVASARRPEAMETRADVLPSSASATPRTVKVTDAWLEPRCDRRERGEDLGGRRTHPLQDHQMLPCAQRPAARVCGRVKGRGPVGPAMRCVARSTRVSRHRVVVLWLACRAALSVLERVPARSRTVAMHMCMARIYQHSGVERAAIKCFKEASPNAARSQAPVPVQRCLPRRGAASREAGPRSRTLSYPPPASSPPASSGPAPEPVRARGCARAAADGRQWERSGSADREQQPGRGGRSGRHGVDSQVDRGAGTGAAAHAPK